jgi:hypothetical protein
MDTETGTEKGTVKWIATSLLCVDHTYGRMPSEAKIRKIAANWDWLMVGVLTVGERKNGGLYVVDGQHRLLGARKAGIENLRCAIFPSMGPMQEAQLYNRIAIERTRPKPHDLFKSAVVGGGFVRNRTRSVRAGTWI